MTGAVVSNVDGSLVRRCCFGFFLRFLCCCASRCRKNRDESDEIDGSYNYDRKHTNVNLVCCGGHVSKSDVEESELNRGVRVRRSKERNKLGTVTTVV